MDIKDQVTKWVENKIEKIVTEDLKEKVTEENTLFDVEVYIDNLLDEYFNENDVINLKESLSTDYYDSLYFDSENSSDERNTSHNSLELESNGYHTFSVEEIIKYLKNDSEENKRKSLQALEISAEDLINQTSWNELKKILQRILNNDQSREAQNLVLKVFQKLLKHPKKTQTVCKGFITVAEIVTNQINSLSLKADDNASFEKIYNIKEGKWMGEKKFSDLENSNLKNQKSVNIEVLIKLMWLLIDCQQQIPIKWMRFNETMFREIIFSFIQLLNSTTTKQDAKLSGLELLSVLNPKASWCRYWCHTAVGRSLLCSALRKYKNFFVQMVEIILSHMKRKKSDRLPSMTCNKLNENPPKFESNITETLKSFKKYTQTNQIETEKAHLKARHLDDRSNYCCSAPSKLKESTPSKHEKHERQKKPKHTNSEFIIHNIPKEVVKEAVFLHSISFVSCLIQFRSGRALFPIQTATRKRLLSVQDLALSIIEHLENTENYKRKNAEIIFTSAYEAKVLEILCILKKVKTHVISSRMNTEKPQFSYP